MALPLSPQGIAVSGIELSPGMTGWLRAKPGADAVPVTTGDMTTTWVPGRLSWTDGQDRRVRLEHRWGRTGPGTVHLGQQNRVSVFEG